MKKVCPNCYSGNWEHRHKDSKSGIVTCVCNDCDHRFRAYEAIEDDGTGHEQGFHNDPRAWSK